MNSVKKSMSESQSCQNKSYEQYLCEIKEQISFYEFEGTDDEQTVEEICRIIADVMMSPDGKPYKIKNAIVTAAVVKQKFAELNLSNIWHVLEKYSKITYRINDVPAYVTAMLYNSVTETELRLINEVNVGLNQ